MCQQLLTSDLPLTLCHKHVLILASPEDFFRSINVSTLSSKCQILESINLIVEPTGLTRRVFNFLTFAKHQPLPMEGLARWGGARKEGVCEKVPVQVRILEVTFFAKIRQAYI